MRLNDTPFRTIRRDGCTREVTILGQARCPCGFGMIVLGARRITQRDAVPATSKGIVWVGTAPERLAA